MLLIPALACICLARHARSERLRSIRNDTQLRNTATEGPGCGCLRYDQITQPSPSQRWVLLRGINVVSGARYGSGCDVPDIFGRGY